jgi:hypothetical protein
LTMCSEIPRLAKDVVIRCCNYLFGGNREIIQTEPRGRKIIKLAGDDLTIEVIVIGSINAHRNDRT